MTHTSKADDEGIAQYRAVEITLYDVSLVRVVIGLAPFANVVSKHSSLILDALIHGQYGLSLHYAHKLHQQCGISFPMKHRDEKGEMLRKVAPFFDSMYDAIQQLRDSDVWLPREELSS